MKKSTNLQSLLQADKEIKDSFSVARINSQNFSETPFCRITYNRILMVEAGSGVLRVDESEFKISGRELFLLAKGQLYAFGNDTKITGYELCFGDCFWERTPASANNCKAVLYNNAAANQQIPLNGNDLAELLMLLNTIDGEFQKDNYINKLDVMAAYLKIIMIKIANVNASLIDGYDSHHNQLYRRFLELVSKQYQNTHEVADFANQLGISARKLSDLCVKCSGRGAKEIINGQLVAEAKRSLQFSSVPVKEIAFKLNFSTPDQFSHFFKKNAQVSPHQYRSHFVNIGI